MIERRQYYICKCDNCKQYYKDYDIDTVLETPVRATYKRDLIKWLGVFGWKRKGKKWFCPNCWGKK